MPEAEGGKSGFEGARQHVREAAACARKGMEGMLPQSFVEHRRAARREMLLAVRSLLDAALERTETKG
jgi:hypothetical protein